MELIVAMKQVNKKADKKEKKKREICVNMDHITDFREQKSDDKEQYTVLYWKKEMRKSPTIVENEFKKLSKLVCKS